MSSTSHSPSPETMTRASTAADTPAAATPGSTTADLPNLAEMAITTLVEDPPVEKDTAKPSKATGKGKKRARASDSYDIAGHIDSSTLEKANKRARGEKVKEEEQTTSLPSMEQPELITGARLKDYQPEETLQTISFLAHMKSKGVWGPFLIVCPLSVLHNWISEFEKFAPSIPVCMYHGSPQHRVELRQTVLRQPTSNASPPKPKRGRSRKKADNELPEQTT
ncbi:ATP-dependent DNA helicase [Rhizoctonia solani]|uniref:ATP-dependent DNA helicase n=1 Tax=Rhizoctonia solani TaxID=456999 RepID=A0A8H8SYC2_9AGAM|nr:ATP-dependent DNA helicase [Rhizoctonia solani]QRW23036.1 ATP-dependent DNA helicase [Rhizoctonia solani]